MKTIRCTDCAAEFSDEDLDDGVVGCPTCGTKSVPCSISEDVTLKINWHELRILGIWASNYAGDRLKNEPGSQRTLNSILKRLQAQYPEKMPLTLFGEIQQVARDLDTKVELHAGGTVTVVEPPRRTDTRTDGGTWQTRELEVLVVKYRGGSSPPLCTTWPRGGTDYHAALRKLKCEFDSRRGR